MKTKLKELSLFKNLDDKTIDHIETFTTEQSFPKDSIIFYEGDEANSMYILIKGIVKLYKVTSSEKEIVLKYFHANEFLAEVANFEGMNYPATAQAATEVEILKIDFNALKQVMMEQPEICYGIMTSLVKKIKNLENLVSMHIVLDAQERVAKYIVEHTDDFFKTKNVVIAEMLNISPETLSRILRVFKNDKIVDTTKKTINKEALENYFN